MLIVWISGFAVENVFFQETQSKIPNKQQTEKQKITQKTKNNISKHKNKQNRFNILRGALFLWFLVSVFEWLHRHDRRAQARSASHPAKANPPFSSRELPTPHKQPPILEPKRGGCFGGLSKQRPCLTQKCSLGPKQQKTKLHGECWIQAGTVLLFWFLVSVFFCFFGSLVLCILVFWFFGFLV